MGMQLVEGSSPCVKDHILISNDTVDCNGFLHIIPMILNLRTKCMGLNQVRSAFYPKYDLLGENAIDVCN
jgi:hypothetical protein